MNSTSPQLSVVILVLNDSGNIRPLIGEIEHALSERLRFEIVIVDDGSTDATEEELANLVRAKRSVKVQFHGQNRGRSAAIRTGVNAARAPVVAVMDGTGKYEPDDVVALFAALDISENVSMVVGEPRRRKNNWIRRIVSGIVNAVRSKLFGNAIRDISGRLKIFYRDAYLELPVFDHVHGSASELMQRQGRLVRSLPVNDRLHLHGK
jgi:glycosyltransferase involved in cell wall biosynthesis